MTRGAGWWTGWALDVRCALRVVMRSRGFAAVAILSLGIGVGANTALYGAVRYALIDPLPVERPGDLRLVYWMGPDQLAASQMMSGGFQDPVSRRQVRSNVSYPAARAAMAAATAANHVPLAAYNFLPPVTVTPAGGAAVAAGGLMASGNFHDLVRVPVAMGRGLRIDDDAPGAAPVVVVGHAFWSTHLGGRPDAVGQSLGINGAAFTIVGVTAPAFRGISTGGRLTPLTDVTIPLAQQPLVWQPDPAPLASAVDRLWVRLIGRVPPGVARAARETAETTAATDVRQAILGTGLIAPAESGTVQIVMRPGLRGVDSLSERSSRPLLILAGVAGTVLLLACVNLASLMLARGVSRQREMTVRRALGGSRLRLVRQLLIESALIAVAGGIVGTLFALWTTPVIAAMMSTGLGAASPVVPIDWRTLALAGAVSGVALVLFALLPALALTRVPASAHLRHQALGGDGRRLTLGRGLLAVQLGISLPLLVVAGLLLQSVRNLQTVPLGFDPSGLLSFRLDPQQNRDALPANLSDADRQSRLAAIARRLVERVEAVPGVSSATLIENPLVSGWMSNNRVTVDGRQEEIYMNGVGPRFFETVRVPVLSGRVPTLEDTPSTPRVTVINRTAARRLFGDSSPIGRTFVLGRREVQVVGVVEDTKYDSLRAEAPPTMFDPYLQRAAGGTMTMVVRASSTETPMRDALRRAVAEAVPGVPMTDVRSQDEQIALTIGREHLVTRMVGVFSVFALALACIGLYGVTSYAVARRTGEIGLRLALGAEPRQVVWLMLRQVLVVAAAGLAIGVPAAVVVSPLAGSLLYGLAPGDAATLVGSGAVLIVVALAAGFLPARRASRIAPLVALRRE